MFEFKGSAVSKDGSLSLLGSLGLFVVKSEFLWSGVEASEVSQISESLLALVLPFMARASPFRDLFFLDQLILGGTAEVLGSDFAFQILVTPRETEDVLSA